MKTNTISKLSLALIATMALTSTSVSANDSSEMSALKQEIKELREMMQSFKASQAPSSAYTELKKSIKEDKVEIAELKETTQALIDEASDASSGYTAPDQTKSHSGLGAAASKVYYSSSPLSIGGYAKMDYYYQSREGRDNRSNIDVYRFIPYIGYKFTDNIIMNAEIEFEHGGVEDGATGKDGYVIIEFLYLDFLIENNFNLRLGNQLVPMGLFNQKHEPTLFTTTQRPNTSKQLIPSTWHENGLMAYGNITDTISYNIGAFSGLQYDRGAGAGNKWLRKSRVGSFRLQNDEDIKLGTVARIDYTGNNLFLGASTYIDSSIVMADIHFDYKKDALRAYGVYTQTSRSKTVAGEPEKAKGGFINLGYDISSITNSKSKMPVFVQYESVTAQAAVTGGASLDSTDTVTLGVNYFPHEQVVLKADYAMSKDNSQASNADETDIFTLSMGFIF